MKHLNVAKADHKSTEAVPSAAKTTKTPQPAPHDPKSDAGQSAAAKRQREIAADPDEAKPREHADAVSADRQPVAAPRSQDADPDANKGVTITTEGGQPVAHPGSALQ